MISLMCDETQSQSLRELLPDGNTMTPDDCIGRIIAQLQSNNDPDDDDGDDSSSDGADAADANAADDPDAGDGAANANNSANSDEASDAFNASRHRNQRHRILASRRISSAAMRAIVSGLTTQAQRCVKNGAITPITRDRLIEALVQRGGKPNVLALSAAAPGETLAMQVFSILEDNEPVALGSRTGLQAMLRTPPDDAGSRGEPLYKKMAALADGRRVEL
jgi:hypothetical protein